MAVLGRIVVVLFAILCASLAASLVLTIGVLARGFNEILLFGWETGTLAIVVGLGWVVITGVALLPVLGAVAMAEAFGWRSVLYYAGAGMLLALLAWWGGGAVDSEADLAVGREIAAAAGIAGGLAYWALAGRKAGAWRGSAAARADPAR